MFTERSLGVWTQWPKSVAIYQQMRKYLSFYVSLSYPKMLLQDKKTAVLSQDVFNTHLYKCIRMNIRIFFLEIIITLLGHWFGMRQRLIMWNISWKGKKLRIGLKNLLKSSPLSCELHTSMFKIFVLMVLAFEVRVE